MEDRMGACRRESSCVCKRETIHVCVRDIAYLFGTNYKSIFATCERVPDVRVHQMCDASEQKRAREHVRDGVWMGKDALLSERIFLSRERAHCPPHRAPSVQAEDRETEQRVGKKNSDATYGNVTTSGNRTRRERKGRDDDEEEEEEEEEEDWGRRLLLAPLSHGLRRSASKPTDCSETAKGMCVASTSSPAICSTSREKKGAEVTQMAAPRVCTRSTEARLGQRAAA
eukprot:11313-Rhodomonas_salina.1